jgi:ankyrin repeat protein
MTYKNKYLKYKNKYLKLKNNLIQTGGAFAGGNIDNDLLDAIEHQNEEKVINLLNNGANPNGAGNGIGIPLFKAASDMNDDPTILNRLIRAGAVVGIVDTGGNSVLHAAVVRSNRSIIRRLIELGVNIDHRNVYGDTPIMNAYHAGIVKILIAAGANLTFINNFGRNVLDINYEFRIFDTVRILLKAGVRPGPSWKLYKYINVPGYEKVTGSNDDMPSLQAPAGGGGGSAGGNGNIPSVQLVQAPAGGAGGSVGGSSAGGSSAGGSSAGVSVDYAGINFKSLNKYGRNILDLNYENGYFNTVESLLKAGARPGPSSNQYAKIDVPGYQKISSRQ